jgi:signal peptidase I
VKILFKIFDFIVIIFVLIFLVTTLALSIFKIKPHTVISDSMHPTIKKYSFVYIKYLKNDEKSNLEVNDIVLIDGTNPFVHRIININDNSFETKGDHNESSDGFYAKDKIIGKYLFQIPWLGVLFINKIFTLMIIVFLVSFRYLIVLIKKK